MSNRVAEHASLTTGSVVRILYVNGSGQTSERSISVKGRFTSREGVTYLRAFCHLRQEERVFRTDRVLGILDEQTEHAATRDVPERAPVFRTPLHGYPMNTCPAQTEPARNEANRPVKRRVRRGFFGQLIVLAVLTFAVLLAVEDRFPNITIRDRLLPPTRTARSAASTATHEPSSKREEPPVVPPDATWYDTYRGQQFKADRVSGRVSYTHLQTGVRFADAHSLRVTVNESILGAAWSIESPDLTRMFGDADSNRDGWLSWGEIKQFQRWLWNTYRYLSNAKALTPIEFVTAGGGDCEDWAIMTAALLYFWGMDSRIGLVNSRTGLHAVTLVPASNLPSGFMIIRTNMENSKIETSYTPIDYYHVGSLSTAVGPTFTLDYIYNAPEVFGRPF